MDTESKKPRGRPRKKSNRLGLRAKQLRRAANRAAHWAKWEASTRDQLQRAGMSADDIDRFFEGIDEPVAACDTDATA
jgi:hypothetical protein